MIISTLQPTKRWSFVGVSLSGEILRKLKVVLLLYCKSYRNFSTDHLPQTQKLLLITEKGTTCNTESCRCCLKLFIADLKSV